MSAPPIADPRLRRAVAPPRPVDFSWTIVPHTHWDREWYLPFEAFRLRLARTVEELLDLLEREPEFRAFTLDGQSVILEDVVELLPDLEPRLRRMLASGRLVAGPAYVLPDEYLAPQEALVRNFLIGSQVARRFGAEPMRAGYQPDPFGHVAQLPQVLQGFGLASFIFWRGMGDQGERVGSLFAWRAPDGSTVTAIRQLGGYGNASELGRWGREGRDYLGEPAQWEDVAVDRLQRYLDRWGAEVGRDGIADLLLCNGSDHQPAWTPLPRMVAAMRRAYPGIDVAVGTYDEYVDRLAGVDRAVLPVVDGELREGRDDHILRGIDSVRMYLKQANEHASQALLGAETLASLAFVAGRAAYPTDALRRAWRLFLRNQPHDSISGCSVDHVHDEMETRCRNVEQIAARVETEAIAALAGRVAPWLDEGPPPDWLSVVNVLPRRRRLVARVALPPVLADGRRGLVAETADGPVPVQRAGGHGLVAVDVPGFGATTIRLRGTSRRDSFRRGAALGARAAGPAAIENEHYRVEAAPNGTLAVTALRTGRQVTGVGLLQDAGDRGDEYDFCPVDGETPWTSEHVAARSRVTARGPVVAEIEIRFDAVLPARLAADRARRVGNVRCPVRTTARLIAGVDRVELTTEVDNRALDHRLRVLVPAPDGGADVLAEGHFAVLRRPAVPVQPRDPATWAQLPQPTHHTTGFVAAGSTVLMARGLPEYEAIPRPGGGLDLALTLLRCVGWLSRGDLATRPRHAGPALETPGAQCPGSHAFEYALRLVPARDGLPDVTAADLVNGSADFRAWARLGPPAADGGGLIDVDGDVAFAALKGAEAGDGVVLRLYNPGTADAALSVRAVAGPIREIRLDEADAGTGRAPTVLPGGRILSVHVAADGPRRDLP